LGRGVTSGLTEPWVVLYTSALCQGV